MVFAEKAGVLKRLFSAAVLAGLLFVPLLLGGCPSPKAHAPAAPLRAVLAGDVVGSWRYADVPEEASGGGWIVTIEFAGDGTFRQTLVAPQARNRIVQTGAWRIENAALKMEQIILWDEAAAGHWARRAQTWPVIESARRPGALAVRGGLAADPALGRELARISDTECRLLTSLAPAPPR